MKKYILAFMAAVAFFISLLRQRRRIRNAWMVFVLSYFLRRKMGIKIKQRIRMRMRMSVIAAGEIVPRISSV